MNETWDRLKVQIVVPQAATNLVTNPSVETNDTGYTLVGASVTKERVATYQRRGAYSLKITPVNGVESGVYFGDISVTSGEQYSISVDVHAPDGENFYLKVLNTTGTSRGSTTFGGIGYWKRESLTFTAAATESIRIYITRFDSETSTDPFYIDGLQLENNSEPTTYFDGDFVGFVPTRNDFGWNGTRHASTSYRTAKTRAGGSLVNLADYATIINVLGLGMGQFSQSYSDLNTGGALYEKHTRNTTPFSIILQFSGNNHGEMAAKRAAVINAVRPDNADDQPMIVRVTAIDDTVGYVAGQPVDIPCMLLPSLTDTPQLPSSQRTALQFRSLDGVLPGAFHEGAQLDFADSLTFNYIGERDSDGLWNDMDGGLTNFPLAIKKGPDGNVYVGGAFTNVGGDADADYLLKWDGSAWSDIGLGAVGIVRDIAFDSQGNLYAVGSFTNAGGDADADYIAKWDGSTWSAVGTPSAGATISYINAVYIDALDNIYVVGYFSNFAGVAAADYIAKWNGSAWEAVGTPNTGAASITIISDIAEGPDGYLYVCGNFSNLGDVAGADDIAKWTGSAWEAVGTPNTGTASLVIMNSLKFLSNGNLLLGGDFTNIGGNTSADYIAEWNGSTYNSIVTGLDSAVWDIEQDSKGRVYVCGEFTTANGISLLDRAFVYEDGAVSSLSIDIAGSDPLYKLHITDEDVLYIGGLASGASTFSAASSVSNSGGASVYPTLRVDGPGLIHQIKDFTTGAQITFSNLTLLTGEVLTINLEPTNLTIVSSFRGDCLNYIASGSDLADFYLQPGTNNISLLMTGTDGDTDAVMYWPPNCWSLDQTKYGV